MNHDNEAVNAFQQYFRPGLHLSSHLDTWMVAWSMQQQKIDELKNKFIELEKGSHRTATECRLSLQVKRLEALLREARAGLNDIANLDMTKKEGPTPYYIAICTLGKLNELGGKE